MADTFFLKSKAKGTWEYEIEEGKVKVKYPIKFDFNEIPESHRKTLEDNPGYQSKIARKVYEVLKPKAAMMADKRDTKSIDAAKELKEAKALFNAKVSELKEEHKTLMKKEKEERKAQVQQLTDSRGEALRQVKELEGEKVTLLGKIAGSESEAKKELELSKDEFNELLKGLEKELLDLKVSSEKKIKSLEGEKKALENKTKAK